MVDTVIIDKGSLKVSVQDGNKTTVTSAHTVQNVAIQPNTPIEVVSVGQVGAKGAKGDTGATGAAGSGIDAQTIQAVPVSATTPNENDVLVSHGGIWTPEPLNGGYF